MRRPTMARPWEDGMGGNDCHDDGRERAPWIAMESRMRRELGFVIVVNWVLVVDCVFSFIWCNDCRD